MRVFEHHIHIQPRHHGFIVGGIRNGNYQRSKADLGAPTAQPAWDATGDEAQNGADSRPDSHGHHFSQTEAASVLATDLVVIAQASAWGGVLLEHATKARET